MAYPSSSSSHQASTEMQPEVDRALAGSYIHLIPGQLTHPSLPKPTIFPFPPRSPSHAVQRRMCSLPSHPYNNVVEDSLYDSSDDEDQPIHPLALAGAKSRKKAYNQWGAAYMDYVVWFQLESLPIATAGWTGQWWHVVQNRLPQGATVAPTRLTSSFLEKLSTSGWPRSWEVDFSISETIGSAVLQCNHHVLRSPCPPTFLLDPGGSDNELRDQVPAQPKAGRHEIAKTRRHYGRGTTTSRDERVGDIMNVPNRNTNLTAVRRSWARFKARICRNNIYQDTYEHICLVITDSLFFGPNQCKPSDQACVLITYLSVDKICRDCMSKVEQRGRIQHLFHESMRILLEPLKDAANNRVEMLCADGYVQKIFPVLSSYVADHPEHCLVSCSKYGTCPKCQCPANNLQSPDKYPDCTQLWTEKIIKNTKANACQLSDFYNDCRAQDISGGVYVPFWSGFPHTDIRHIITPNILHQLYQGVFKHIVNWCKQAMSPKELD
ncbi:uncharacterized protein LACBIDRAFT_335428 [Laccaria bicolor S238N-H82]|uniref:Predicted protein n=1 Tax=Laccaria bicolor (strain S238N-H82 / ATCC MYA-4686) TaxID=486041 RepID=B0E2B1_LACBS|nr:uncharacterized protein LACBIDRAFT_335428 [Laccaria bicolor S238N-H82]EDQ99025.1 predicted protein [Laccaria bicolor S238N-H82]|eukprot:XP_001890333.1 predicted protein [Laccaria bicolor S238N-H82]